MCCSPVEAKQLFQSNSHHYTTLHYITPLLPPLIPSQLIDTNTHTHTLLWSIPTASSSSSSFSPPPFPFNTGSRTNCPPALLGGEGKMEVTGIHTHCRKNTIQLEGKAVCVVLSGLHLESSLRGMWLTRPIGRA